MPEDSIPQERATAADLRQLVSAEHVPLYDELSRRARRAFPFGVPVAPEEYAALQVALVQSAHAHDALVKDGEAAAAARTPLVQFLVGHMFDGDASELLALTEGRR